MIINTQKLQRLVFATVLASGIVSTGIAASAQTTAAPVAPATATATTVTMSTTSTQNTRKAELEQANADARRNEFLHQGTSL